MQAHPSQNFVPPHPDIEESMTHLGLANVQFIEFAFNLIKPFVISFICIQLHKKYKTKTTSGKTEEVIFRIVINS